MVFVKGGVFTYRIGGGLSTTSMIHTAAFPGKARRLVNKYAPKYLAGGLFPSCNSMVRLSQISEKRKKKRHFTVESLSFASQTLDYRNNTDGTV